MQDRGLLAPEVLRLLWEIRSGNHESRDTDDTPKPSGAKSTLLPGSPTAAAVPASPPAAPAKTAASGTPHRSGKAARASTGKSATVKVSTRKKRIRTQ
ncbi:MAG: hypothetical protein QM784_15525 [Polyangiaceae bacterium]